VATVRLAAGLIYTPQVLARFDIVGMDPRGVGGSTPIRCYDSPQEEAAFEADYPMFPVTPEENKRSAAKAADLANRCRAHSGWELTHLSTANVARDMDLLRQAIGESKLYYVGYSYGSYLGETYAAMFPDRVAAMVLDSVIDPSRYATALPGLLGSMPFLREGSDLGAADALAEFHTACRGAGATRCPFAADGDPAATFDHLVDRLRERPLTVDTPTGPVHVGSAELISYTISQLYAARYWPRLAATLHALAGGDATPLAAQLPDRAAGQLIDEQQLGVLCSEVDTVNTALLLPAVARAAERRAPYAGAMWAYAGAQCVNWPARDPDRYLGPWTARTATPALIVNSRHDPATPYRNAQALQRLMPGSRLLTHNGWGHETVLVSSCVDRTIERYLTERELPAPGTACEPDSRPFG
jgi:pimeloyl-ACP methyl ester carboxylesterase